MVRIGTHVVRRDLIWVPHIEGRDENEARAGALHGFYRIEHLQRALVVDGLCALLAALATRARTEIHDVRALECSGESGNRRVLEREEEGCGGGGFYVVLVCCCTNDRCDGVRGSDETREAQGDLESQC
jgi:hypothetical protein